MNLTDLSELALLELEADFSGKSEAYFVRSRFQYISLAQIEAVKRYLIQKKISTTRINIHSGPMGSVHEMIIFQTKGSDFPAHKHLTKSESYQIISGSLLIQIHDDLGKITQSIILDLADVQKSFFCKICANTWHSTKVLSETVVFKETRPGPLMANDTVFAT